MTLAAMLFIPFSYEEPLGWFFAVFIISLLFIYFGTGLRTKIAKNMDSGFFIEIPDHSSNTVQRIPLDLISHAEVGEYNFLSSDSYYPKNVDKEYFYTKRLFGYVGPSLIVCYQLPTAHDSIIRGIQFPAPKAQEFLNFIKDHS